MDPQRATAFDCPNPPVTKEVYLEALQMLYRVANLSDSDDHPDKVDWLDSDASVHQCRPMDQMLEALVAKGCITAEEKQEFYNTL